MTLGLDNGVIAVAKPKLLLNRVDDILSFVELAWIVQVYIASLELSEAYLAYIRRIVGHWAEYVEHTVIAIDDNQIERLWMKMISGHSNRLGH